MVRLYALVDRPARLPDGGALKTVDVGRIDAVYGNADDAGEPTDEAVLAHADVVERLAAVNDAVLPARYPGRYDDEAALAAAVQERAPQLEAALGRVRGCVELGVRVVREGRGGEAAASGADYMRRRLAEVNEAEALAAEVDAAVAAMTRDATKAVTATADLVLSAAYLVPRGEVDAFRAAVDRVAEAHGDLAFVCVGPWPPYSFALVDGGAPA